MKPSRIFKKKEKSRIISLMVLSFVFVLMSVVNDVKAAEFTLGPVPTPRNEVSFTEATTATVTTEAEFISAYANSSINRIVLANDISFSNTSVANIAVILLSRSLQIDGGSHKMTFSNFTSDGVFRLSTTATNVTFHLKDIELEKTAGANAGILIRLASPSWDIIFEDVTNDQGVNWNSIGLTTNGTPVFFRGSNGPFRIYGEIWEGSGNIVFEEDSTFNSSYAPVADLPVFL